MSATTITTTGSPGAGGASGHRPDIATALDATPTAHRRVVWLRGEHDIATASALRATLTRTVELDGTDVVVDLHEVEFLAVATTRVLWGAHQELRARSRELVLRSPSRCVRRVLELCGLGDLIEDDLSQECSIQVPGSAGGSGPTVISTGAWRGGVPSAGLRGP